MIVLVRTKSLISFTKFIVTQLKQKKMSSISSNTMISRQKELKAFDDTKLGVKGLVDSGITRIPSFFHHPPDSLIVREHNMDYSVPIPVIDLSSPTLEVVDQIKEAAARFGFFQVINHGVSHHVLDCILKAVKAFHELPGEERMKHYQRDTDITGFGYFSNRDLFISTAASWRDSFLVRLGPTTADFDAIPPIIRNEVIEWDQEVKQLGDTLLGLLSQGLGVKADKLKEMSCLGGRKMAGQYYPYCPEPNKTVGIASHTDPGVLTVLLQDQVGGLQVKFEGKWVDVKPIHGALVINVGDFLKMISNDKYKSVEHRVYANSLPEPRVSVAVFFSPSMKENLYGPLAEILSAENEPAHYKEVTYSDFFTRVLAKKIGG